MKKFILLILIACINSLSAADRDNDMPARQKAASQEDLLSLLPPEIKEMIIRQLASANPYFEETIEKLKGLFSLFMVNKAFSQYRNQINIPAILELLAKKFNIPKTAIAFALGSNGALQWLQNKYPQNTFLSVFNDIFKDRYLNSSFLNSHYFTELVMKLSQGNFVLIFDTLLAHTNFKNPNWVKKIGLLLAARADLLTDNEILGQSKLINDVWNSQNMPESVWKFSPWLKQKLFELRERLKTIERQQRYAGYESDETLTGSEHDSDYGSDFE